MLVKNWMSSPPVVIAPGIRAQTALDFMEKHRIRRLPVVQSGALVGIVTRSDLESALGRHGRAAAHSRRTVEEFMTPGPLTVSPMDTLESVSQLMLRHKISGVPVVNGEKIVGILTESDLFQALCSMMGFSETGPRIALDIPDHEDLLDAVRRRIGRLRVRSIATVHNARSRRFSVVVRVRGRLPEATVPSKED
ncbi:MAG: CBS domain-containing protein [Planctomycetes bacterium]|nr:CBS domain-containing protein [Planctomycetota bacterium]